MLGGGGELMYHQSLLANVLDGFREAAQTEYEAGAYFEELIAKFLTTEARYRDLYARVMPYGAWAMARGRDNRDTGIDLVAETHTGEIHAIQCKFYARDYRVQKADIDSFFTASGQKPFTHRVIVATTNNWSDHAEAALYDQQPPVSKIDFHDLDNSQIDWSRYKSKAAPVLKPKKELRDHQSRALKAVVKGLEAAERGKMIMACGTGKTFTSLKIAEAIAGKGGRVLFLVPSLNLLSQSLTEWSQEAAIPIHCFAVCSDSDVGKKRKKDDEAVQTFVHELRYPATTDAKKLADEVAKRHDASSMTVVFSTYHSIDTIGTAQKQHKLADFDLVICDEAHRTTGATFEDDDESAFIRVHDEKFVRGAKRLYMTATPRIYSDAAQAMADKDNVALCSMDDESLYGKELFVITFSEAVQRGLLVDYKVIVLAIEEAHISRRLQQLLDDGNNQLKVHDAARIVGCWKALSKQNLTDLGGDAEAMRRAVAFCQVIEAQSNGKTHKVSSKKIASMFQAVVEAYQKSEGDPAAATIQLKCQAEHVDGGMNATAKEDKLAWLKEDAGADTCRILSNVRCLSEGVDVPALDAVLFLTPRNSQVDVVQSVGRVMRIAPGKTRGYVVLPVVIPAGMEPHEALNDNQVYRVVWQVLQALRSHDDRFDAMINKLDLIGQDTSKMEVIAVTDKIQRRQKKDGRDDDADRARSTTTLGSPPAKGKKGDDANQINMEFDIGEIERAIYAKVVKKCGNRLHWEEWAGDIARIAQTHIDRITGILENPKSTAAKEAFDRFAADIRDDLNPSISDGEIVEMLAQHMITKPVFEALFADFSFAQLNPMSKAMQGVLDVLDQHHVDKEADTLQRFYDSVKMRASGIDNAQGKQKIVVELYDKFFRNAFPKMTERLGIVYTPVEVVDFIIHSVNDVLKSEFGETLGSDGVHIIDPFTGTGTFITRLLQSGLMTPDEIRKKFAGQLHANEIVLLAYYIAAINIESTYHGIVGGDYVPFDGICLTDTYQMYEKDDLIDHMLVDNSKRRRRQKKLDIRVIVGNPPYAVGQEDANDNNQNLDYPALDSRIRDTYAARSQAQNKNGLYNSYIRAIRWASDRIGASGVIGFVTNGGFLDGNAADGLRKCLADEFSSLYVFHLRGNQRTAGELSRKEGGKIFGGGSRAPIAISILVKNPKAAKRGQIHFHDIGDYLSREDKLATIAELTSIYGIANGPGWRMIEPDAHGDWLKQRNTSFAAHIAIGDKEGTENGRIFENYSNGVQTNRDAWCFNASKARAAENVKRMIDFYNGERTRLTRTHPNAGWKERHDFVDNFVDTNPTKISWTRALKRDLAKDKPIAFDVGRLVQAIYRPYHKQWVYFSRDMNELVYQMPRIFPDATAKNLLIGVSAPGATSGFTAIMTDVPSDLCLAAMKSGTQCFPLYLYEADEATDAGSPLFATKQDKPSGFKRRDAITDDCLAHFGDAYPGEAFGKEDLFYYVYGLLHSPDYRERFADNLGKELPRIPRVKTAAAFWAFSKAGRALGDLHINYDTAPIYEGAKVTHSGKTRDYRVEKMRYGGKGRGTAQDRTTLHYNDTITVTGIPLEAYEYVVNGKPALDWVVDRQCAKTDKDSGIVNDANDWAIETMNNPKYPLELFLRIITVSLETMKIVNALPKLDVHEKG